MATSHFKFELKTDFLFPSSVTQVQLVTPFCNMVLLGTIVCLSSIACTPASPLCAIVYHLCDHICFCRKVQDANTKHPVSKAVKQAFKAIHLHRQKFPKKSCHIVGTSSHFSHNPQMVKNRNINTQNILYFSHL
jgi:hypothetical protein